MYLKSIEPDTNPMPIALVYWGGLGVRVGLVGFGGGYGFGRSALQRSMIFFNNINELFPIFLIT